MKKFSLFILGILFCAVNAWGQMSGYYGDVNYSMSYGMSGAITTVTGLHTSNITSVTIPASIPQLQLAQGGAILMALNVTNIANGAFSSTMLTTVTFESTTPPTLDGTFANTFPNGIAIKVPSSAIGAYEDAGYSNVSSSGASGPATSGNCGDANLGEESDLAWSYDADSHTLTFTNKAFWGDVYMANYELDGSTYKSTCPWNAFKSEITTVVFPSDLANIGDYAFYGFSGLTSIVIPNVTTIGDYAFCNCSNLTDVTIKSTGDLTIGASAFSENVDKSLSLTMKTATAPTIDESSFANRKGLNSNPKVAVTVPSAAAKTAYESAWGIENFEFTVAAVSSGSCGTNLNWSYDNHVLTISGTGTTMDDYETTFENFVTSWFTPWDEFLNDITSINITASNLQHIGDNAFRACPITTTPTFPSNLQTIGDYAFAYCTSLSSATIPATITSLGNGVFANANHLTSVTFEANSQLTAISDDLFNYCAFEEITLPNGITSIGKNAFNSNDAMTSITIPATVASIGDGAFTSCPILSEITVLAETPPSVTSTSSVFQSGVTFIISDNAICTYAEQWGIGYNYKNALGETLTCDALQHGNCGENLQWSYDVDSHTLTITGYGEMFNYSSEEGSRAPWIEIGLASSLEHVIFPEGITTIGDSAFTGISGLKIVTIPATVTSIGKQAFYGCQYLRELTMLGNTPPVLVPYTVPIFNVTFQPIAGVLDVYVPTSAVNTYKSAWGESIEMSQYSMGYGSMTYEGCTLRYYGKDANETFVGFNDATVNGTLQKIQFHDGETIDRITIGRPAQRNGYFNTLCLPFNLDADQINHSSLNGAELYTFSDVQITDTWDLVFERVYEVTANTPYLFRYVNAPDQSPLSQLDFEDVTIVSPMNPYSLKSGPYDVSTDGIDDISLFGTITSQVLAYTGAFASTNDYLTRLFVGANNMLYTVDPTKEETLSIGAFRAYFQFDKNIEVSIGYAPSANRGSRIVLKEETATDIDKVENNKTNTQKLLLNGRVIINRNGVQYNTAGQIIK